MTKPCSPFRVLHNSRIDLQLSTVYPQTVELNESILIFVADLTPSVDNPNVVPCVSSPQYR